MTQNLRSIVASHTPGDIIGRTARRVPDKVALIDDADGATFTFAQLDAAADGVAAALQDDGLVKGDIVLTFVRNCWQAALLPFAAPRAGVVVAPANPLLGPGEMAALVRLVRPRAILAEEHSVPAAARALRESGRTDVRTLCLRPPHRALPRGWRDAAAWFEHAGTPAPVALDDDDLIRLMFTSGTESGPKAVMLSSRNLMWQYATFIHSAAMTGDDVELHTMPLHHCGQLDCFLGPDLMLGCTSVVLNTPTPARIAAAIVRHGVTRMFATPSKWIELLHSDDLAALRQLTKGCFGASAMPVPVLHEMARTLPGLRMWNLYGQTEMSPAASMLGPDDQLRRAGSVGQPVIDVDLAILDEQGRELGTDAVGEICFRSPQACLGYLDDEAATARLFRGGWLHTGDVGYRTADGYLWFVDRIKDTVNVGGEKVASREVEDCIYRLPAVHECAVFAVPDPHTVEAIVAVVSPRPGLTVTEDDVRTHVRHHLAPFKVPRHVVVWNTLPKNATGKILKRALRERFASVPLHTSVATGNASVAAPTHEPAEPGGATSRCDRLGSVVIPRGHSR